MTSPYDGMTVNERLVLSGLMDAFDRSIKSGDFVKAAEILTSVDVSEDSIIAILDRLKHSPNAFS